MRSRVLGGVIACLAALVVLTSAPAFGQGGSIKTVLSGTVVDAAAGVIPGATIVVKNTETGLTFNTITNADGAFSVPALDPGTYSVTVSLSGFKTTVIPNQRLIAASPASIKVTLEVGSCWLANPQALPPVPMAPTTS
jgi:Carboxypeptidase regulatory-like domain